MHPAPDAKNDKEYGKDLTSRRRRPGGGIMRGHELRFGGPPALSLGFLVPEILLIFFLAAHPLPGSIELIL